MSEEGKEDLPQPEVFVCSFYEAKKIQLRGWKMRVT
jgi:hypothetical protein